LPQQLDWVTLPRKGKLSQERHAVEHTEAFTHARRAHLAVESVVNALKIHGLDFLLKKPEFTVKYWQHIQINLVIKLHAVN